MAQPTVSAQNATNASVRRFRNLVRRAILLEGREAALFEQIPDVHFERILSRNFNGSLALAERVLFNRHAEIDALDRPLLDRRKRAIKNLDAAADRLRTAMEAGHRVIFLTDNDNDGSMAQAVLLEFLDQLPEDVRKRTMRAYAQAVGKERGLTLENVDLLLEHSGWSADDPNNPVLIVTADIGVNNRASAEAILAKYPGASLLVTDHHLPVPAKQIQDGARCLLFNPQVEPTEHFRRRNISGADTLAVLLREIMAGWAERANVEVAEGELAPIPLADVTAADARMRKLGAWSNLLDYVEADVVDMPLRPHAIDKAMRLRTLLNVSNSMGPLVTTRFTDQDWQDLAQSNPGIDADFVKESARQISGLNAVARRLLAFLADPQNAPALSLIAEQADSKVDSAASARSRQENGVVVERPVVEKPAEQVQVFKEEDAVADENSEDGEAKESFGKRDFYAAFAKVLANPLDYPFDSPNPNFIAQLRPWLFRFGAVDNKPPFADLVEAQMLAVYKQLSKIERGLMDHLRPLDLLERVQIGSATVIWPKSPGLARVFPRKLLSKAYNEDNNGFLLILDQSSDGEFSGSMRALYPIDEIIRDRKALEDKLGVDIEILGHAKAAGFKMIARRGKKLTRRTVERLAREIAAGVDLCRKEEKVSSLPFLDADIATLPLINRINVACRAHLSNMQGLPAVMALGEEGDTDIAITDAKTTEQILLSEVVGRRRYGWQAIRTNFAGDAVIVPIEQLRTIVKGGFRQRLRLGYMDDGAFVGQQAVEPSQNVLIPFRGNRQEENALLDYFNTHLSGGRAQLLTRANLAELPYFKTARTRAWDFARFERLIIDVLDATGQDVFAVIDVEATGLGRAPKCFNIGATNLFVEPGSGFEMEKSDFDFRVFRSEDGLAHLLDESDLFRLVPLSSLSKEQAAKSWRIYNADERGGIDFQDGYALPERPASALYIDNFKVDEVSGKVLVNRRICATGLAHLVKNDDFEITPEMTNLTGITPAMLEKSGEPSAVVDRQLEEYYTSLRNPSGAPAKVVFSAHNLPYDKGVVSSNLPRLNKLMDSSVLCDTARVARQDKLAYDDTPTSTFVGVDAIPRGRAIYFYDSPFSSYSLSTFLSRAAEGKAGEYPDTTGKYMLRYRTETGEVSFVDKEALTETRIDKTVEELTNENRQVRPIPSQSVRYSVERLSSRAMIRNLLLFDAPAPKQVPLINDEERRYAADLAFFQSRYRFEGSLEDNVRDFLISRSEGPGEDILQDVGSRFLDANRDLQGRFHDSWIYERVLSRYEPSLGVPISMDVVYQIAYQTNLSASKVQDVFDRTLAFKREFKIDHALVHEQHNNIRQVSEDGQGLADTAYECVLPGLLAAAKRHNPYTDRLDGAVDLFVETGMRGTMKQLWVKDRHQDKPSVDSFSMKQLLAFDREELAPIVELAKRWEAAGWSEMPQIKFALKSGDLPKGSGVYATPLRALDSEELEEAATRIREVVLFEQVRLSAFANTTGSIYLRQALRQVAEDASDRLVEHKAWLCERFSRVVFDRREASMRKLSDIVGNIVEYGSTVVPPSLIKSLSKDNDMLAEAMSVVATHLDIAGRIGRLSRVSQDASERLGNLGNELVSRIESFSAEDERRAKGFDSTGPRRLTDDGEELNEYLNSPIRDENFLPVMDIRRSEPLEFIVEQAGAAILADTLMARDELPELEEPVVVEKKSRKSRRKP